MSSTIVGQVDIWDESTEFWSTVIIRGERPKAMGTDFHVCFIQDRRHYYPMLIHC